MVNSVSKRLTYPLWLVATGFPFAAHAISIDQAWKAAKQFDPTYAQAQIAVRLSDTGRDISQSALRPSLAANASMNWNEHVARTQGYSASLTQMIWDSTLWTGLDQAEATQVKARLELNQAQNNLAEKLVLAYLDLASAQGDLRLAQRQLAEGKQLLDITEKRYKAGKVKSIDVEEMRANQLNEQVNILQAQSTLADKRAELVALIHQQPDQVDEVNTDDLFEPAMIVKTENDWLRLAKDHSPALLIASQQVRLRQLGKKQAQEGYYPTLETNVGYQDNNNIAHGEFNAGLSLSLPLDLNGATHAEVEQADLNILDAKQAMRSVEVDITKNVQQQFAQVQLNWRQVEMAKQLVGSREKVFRSRQALFNAGLAEASDVIDAHNHLFTAKNTLKTTLYNYWRQRVGLLQTAGRLDEQSIMMISQVLTS